MSELPKGWVETSIGKAYSIENELRKPISLKERLKCQGHYPYYGATGVIDHLNDYTHDGEYVLIGEDGANLLSKNKPLAFIANGQYWVNNHAHTIRSLDGSPNAYLKNYFNSLSLENWVTGSAQPKLNKKNLEGIPIPFAPLKEQKRIVEKLDEVLAQVDAIKGRLDSIPAIIKRFRQSVLASAVSGKLTDEWRKKNTCSITPENFEQLMKLSVFKCKAKQIIEPEISTEVRTWLKVSLGSVFSVKSGDGLTAKNMNVEGNIPVYGGNGVTGTHDSYNSKKPELVIGRVGFYCGSVHKTPEKSWITDNALIASYSEEVINPEYAYWLLLATNLRIDISSSAQPVISGAKIYPILLSIPPMEEQKEIVRLVDEYFALADTIEAQVNKARARVDNLTQSILAKAFRGELVPQDENDEPADKLLERIAQAKAEAEALAKAAKKAETAKNRAAKTISK